MKKIGVFYNTEEFKNVLFWFLTKNNYKCYKTRKDRIDFNDNTQILFFKVSSNQVRGYKFDESWIEENIDAEYYNMTIFPISKHIKTVKTVYDLANILKEYGDTLS